MKSLNQTSWARSLLRPALLCMVLLIAQPVTTAYADSLREVAERVARQNDAKLVSAREVTDRDGRKVYVIRILTRDGVVRTIRVPARDRHLINSHIAALSASGNWHLEIDLSIRANTVLQYRDRVYPQSDVAVYGVWV